MNKIRDQTVRKAAAEIITIVVITTTETADLKVKADRPGISKADKVSRRVLRGKTKVSNKDNNRAHKGNVVVIEAVRTATDHRDKVIIKGKTKDSNKASTSTVLTLNAFMRNTSTCWIST